MVEWKRTAVSSGIRGRLAGANGVPPPADADSLRMSALADEGRTARGAIPAVPPGASRLRHAPS